MKLGSHPAADAAADALSGSCSLLHERLPEASENPTHNPKKESVSLKKRHAKAGLTKLSDARLALS